MFIVARHGGEVRQVTTLKGTVVALEWAANSQSLLVSVSLPVDPNLRGARPGPNAAQPPEEGPQVIWRLSYKADGMGYTLDHEVHLFHVDIVNNISKQLTDGPFNVRSAKCSADGGQIVYSRTREGDQAHRTDVWAMERDGANPRQLTEEYAQVLFPQWSPDGRWIVFCGTVVEGDAQVRAWLLEVKTGTVRQLGDDTLEISTEAQSLQFVGDDSTRVLAIAARRGVQEVLAISVPGGKVQTLVGGERQLSLLACARDRMFYASQSLMQPMEVYGSRIDGSQERCLSHLNAWWQDRVQAQFERRTFEVPDGSGGVEKIDGWLIRPQGAQGPTPLLVEVHGGPASFTLFSYPPIAYWSVLWSKGWSILALNAVGSASYGRAFSDRLCGRWGELDLPQHLAAVQTLQNEGVTDDRVAVLGKSYGGYMACWAVGHTQVFQAAVAIAPISQIEAHWGTSDSGYYTDAYSMHCGDTPDPVPAPALMHRLSPLLYMPGSRVPTLLLQGADDQRCPRGQAEAAFVALRQGGNQNCELVLYPQGSHKFTTQSKPSHRVDAMERVVSWLTRWIKS